MTTKIEFWAGCYEFTHTEISKEDYQRYSAHYREHGVAVDPGTDEWSELRLDVNEMGLDGFSLVLTVNDIEVKNIHQLIHKHRNFTYRPSLRIPYRKDTYHWVAYDYFKGGFARFDTEDKFDFTKLHFYCEEVYLSKECCADLITGITYDDEDLVIENGEHHKGGEEYLIQG